MSARKGRQKVSLARRDMAGLRAVLDGRSDFSDFMWTQQCTTVRAITSRRLLHSNVACLGPTRLLLSPLGVKPSHDRGLSAPDLLQYFADREYPRAVDGILDANRYIWSKLTMTARKTLVLLDEDVSADIVRAHVEYGIEPLSSILLDANTRRVFLRARREIVDSYSNVVLRATTDLFRFRDGTALRPCVIEGDDRHAVLAAPQTGARIPLTSEALTDGLANRALYPDLILTYLALVVLPGMTAFGGASQHEYLPKIEEIALRVHDLGVTFPAEVVERLHTRGHSVLIGPALLELTPHQRAVLLRLSEATDLDAFERDALQRPIRDTTGDLDYLRYLDALRATRLGVPASARQT